jgi:predicted kinase
VEARARPRLIAVCGVPAAGKTTLARGLGVALHLPVVVRDDVKTGYADTHPAVDWADPAVRAVHGAATFDVFHRIVDLHLDAGVGLVAEAAWHWAFAVDELAPRFARSHAVVVAVTVPHEESARRYRARFEAGERHPAHRDDAFAHQMDGPDYDWRRYLPPADLPCPQVAVDGTLPPDALLAATLAALARPVTTEAPT